MEDLNLLIKEYTIESNIEIYNMKPSDLLFFDIETTGFLANTSELYLIGIMYYEDNNWHLKQFFSETLKDEIEILESFNCYLKNKKYLVSFNGDRFDIPYLKEIAKEYFLEISFENIESIDIYKKLRSLKSLLPLKNLSLKSVEEFMGIKRDDIYNGGELISIYKSYLEDRDLEKENTLLHNMEDIKNLLMIMPILNYENLILSCNPNDFHIEKKEIKYYSKHEYLHIKISHNFHLPIKLLKKGNFYNIYIKPDKIEIIIRLFRGKLKYFFEDYENYYYLPKEGYAVHKSLGEFVDKNRRMKAKKATAFQLYESLFIPQLEGFFSPQFHKEYNDTLSYAMYSEDMLNDITPDILRYIRSLMFF